ncbi:apolipoprotein A-IV [Poeciliopsis prolifica]|uniref:apolipoprotein A-IV n=1 Tax=Poeciliopsis prolifica TaxID=188132 RepID=UPI00241311EA|nr:apolipoprotein A-IV [Poeciliopsis prolifica]
MIWELVIVTLSLSTALAHPLHGDSREAAWVDSKANHVFDKTDLSKDTHGMYKSVIDSSGLYTLGSDDVKHPFAEEMQRKLAVESERLRIRLRQELAELRERLSPSPAQLSATLDSIKERLSPLTQQLQDSLSSNTQDLCSQLRLYLQGLEKTAAQAEASPAFYQEAFQWISQNLELSSGQLSSLINDFQTSASGVIEDLKQKSYAEEGTIGSEVWQAVVSKLGQEMSSLREEAQSRVGAFRAQLAALLESTQPPQTDVADGLEEFCHNTALQSQALQARMERLFIGVEEEAGGASIVPLSSSMQEGASLREDFSVRLSALIQDIMHSVQ